MYSEVFAILACTPFAILIVFPPIDCKMLNHFHFYFFVLFADPALADEEVTREFGITLPFGTKSPESFADAGKY